MGCITYEASGIWEIVFHSDLFVWRWDDEVGALQRHQIGGEERVASARDKDVAEHAFHFRLFFFPWRSRLNDFHWYPQNFFICLWIFNTSKQMWCFCRRTKGLGFWALVADIWVAGILDIPPPTEDHIHLISEIDTQPKRRKPRWLEGIFPWETTMLPDIGQPWFEVTVFFFFATKDWYNSQVKYTLVSPGYKYNLPLGLQALKTL